MCHLCVCCGWCLDIIQSVISFWLACFGCWVLMIGIFITMVCGIAFGYYYSMAEWHELTKIPGTRRVNQGENPARFRKASDVEMTLRDFWRNSDDSRDFAEKNTRLGGSRRKATALEREMNMETLVPLNIFRITTPSSVEEFTIENYSTDEEPQTEATPIMVTAFRGKSRVKTWSPILIRDEETYTFSFPEYTRNNMDLIPDRKMYVPPLRRGQFLTSRTSLPETVPTKPASKTRESGPEDDHLLVLPI